MADVAKARGLRVVSDGKAAVVEHLDFGGNVMSRAALSPALFERMWDTFGHALQNGEGLGALNVTFDLGESDAE